jgi:NADH-quinone oxidoreductase subunit L
MMNGVSYVTNSVSDRIKGFQSGQLQQYAWVFVSGAVALALAFIYLWTL